MIASSEKGANKQVAESLQRGRGDGSILDGWFLPPAFTPDGGGGIYCGGSRTCVVNSQRHCWGTSRGNWQVSDVLSYVVLAKAFLNTHAHPWWRYMAGGVQAIWNVTWVQIGILFPQSLLDELIRLRGFLKLVVTPYLCRFQSMNIQLWQKLVHHHTVSRANQVSGGMSARTFPSRSGDSGPWKGESLGKEGEWRGCEGHAFSLWCTLLSLFLQTWFWWKCFLNVSLKWTRNCLEGSSVRLERALNVDLFGVGNGWNMNNTSEKDQSNEIRERLKLVCLWKNISKR